MSTTRQAPKRDASNFDDYVMVSVITILFIGLLAALVLL